MWVILLAVLGCYALAGLLVHALYWLESKMININIEASPNDSSNDKTDVTTTKVETESNDLENRKSQQASDSHRSSRFYQSRQSCQSRMKFHFHLRRQKERHFIFILGIYPSDIEWHLRSLFAFSRLTGRNVKLTIIHHHLSSEQRKLIEKFSQKYGDITLFGDELIDGNEHVSVWQLLQSTASDRRKQLLIHAQIITPNAKVIIVDLNKEEDLQQLPYY
ncbi:hypothetical protein ACFSTH_19485 [Paenibacillus yanchengensis]|uniref:Uncharacterized protein n=1 Tax=Paenibacillus yanchengensis TaxID=2035833 RepID=A0ABW4YNF3_9BACL